MASVDERIVARDVPATVVPYGDAVTIPAGARVEITHRLGGNFTVLWDYGMARINGEHADALGEQPAAKPVAAAAGPGGRPDEAALWAALKTVFDPEIPVNVVDLGLVYSLEIAETAPGTFGVTGKMTLTAPGCGMGPSIAEDAKRRLLGVPGVADAHVDIVWDPPWTQDMISEDGKMQLGLI